MNVVTFSGVVAQKLSALYIFKRAYDYYTQSKVSRRLQYYIHESRHGQRCCSAYNSYIVNTSKREYNVCMVSAIMKTYHIHKYRHRHGRRGG